MKYTVLNNDDWNILLGCVKDDICLDVKEGEYNGGTITWYKKLYDKETFVIGTQENAKYYLKEEE